MEKICLYKDGKGTPYYEPVIKSIRDFLESVDEISKSEGGAIIFFQKKEDDVEDLMMKVYPFKESSFFPKDTDSHSYNEGKLEILRRINDEKPYREFWHFSQFLNCNSSDEHCHSSVPDHNRIRYHSEGIEYFTISSSGDRIFKSVPWDIFFDDLRNNLIEKHTYEQLLFESGCKGVSFIPIPVLSTPSILLVLNRKDVDGSIKNALRSLYFRSRDTVDSYLYSRLLDSLIPLISLHGEGWSEIQLVEAFVKEICHIILPISYSINGNEDVFYYRNWPNNGFESHYTLPLLDGKYSINFRLTSFHYVDLENSTNEWTWIHSSKIYSSNLNQSSLLICKLFKLLHSNWQLIRTVEERAYTALASSIDRMNLGSMRKSLNQLEFEIEQIKTKRDSFGPVSPPVFYLASEKELLITISGQDIITSADVRGKQQWSGFQYLNFILRNAVSNQDSFSIGFNRLYDEVQVVNVARSIVDFKAEKEESEERLNFEIEDILKMIEYFYRTNKDTISRFIRQKNIPDSKFYNRDFYFIAKLVRQTYMRKIIKYKLNGNNVNLFYDVKSFVDASLDRYPEIKSFVDLADVKMYFIHSSWAKDVLGRDGNGVNRKDFVRGCFKAMIKLLRNKAKTSIGDKKSAFDRFILNLESSGLISATKDEPNNQGTYSYNQLHSDHHIEWRFE